MTSATSANVAAKPETRIVAGEPGSSLLLRRLASRDPLLQMPPLGTHAIDVAARDAIAAWIEDELAPPCGDALSRTPACGLPQGPTQEMNR